MKKRPDPRTVIPLICIAILYAVCACVGIGWGLPSKDHDDFLFGGSAAWSGELITRLTQGGARTDPHTGADVDVNPLARGPAPIEVNADERSHAEIYRRFRLFTRQPDETVTMMALSGMNPRAGQFDPKLYQYGGLFIYPVGVAIRCSGALGLFPVRGDLAYYLDHPEDFAPFYVVARLYAAAWGIPGLLIVFAIGRRLGGRDAGLLAALLFVLLPVVVCMSHEAKPHLPGAVLMLAAVWFGMRALDRQTWVDWAGLFVGCGAAVGMVLSSAPILILIPWIIGTHCGNQARRQRNEPRGCQGKKVNYMPVFFRATAGGCLVAGAVYFLCNPYVFINLLWNRAVLASNLGNTAAMFEPARVADGFVRVVQLTAEGATWPVAVAGLVGLAAAVHKRHDVALPLIIPAAVVALLFVLLGADKPAEFGRFGIFYEGALLIGGACVLAAIERRNRMAGMLLTLGVCGWGAFCATGYLWSMHADATGQGSRDLAAAYVRELNPPTVAVVAEPAPYACPPLDFQRVRVVLVRDPDSQSRVDQLRRWNEALRSGIVNVGEAETVPPVLVVALDDPAAELARVPAPAWSTALVFESPRGRWPRSPISWADKPIVILSRARE